MTRPWKIAFLLAVFLLLAFSISLAWSSPPKAQEPAKFALQANKTPGFSAKDRELIENYYDHLIGTLAPGSIDRSGFSPGIEKSLIIGSHVPMQLEKELELLPVKLESGLTQLTGDYGRYRLGRHVLLVKKSDMTIADILKSVAVK